MVRGPGVVWEGLGAGAGLGLGLGECGGEGQAVGWSGAGRVTPTTAKDLAGGREMLVPGLAPEQANPQGLLECSPRAPA